MKINLALILISVIVSGCFYKDLRISGQAQGLTNAVVEISGHDQVWADNVINGEFNIPVKLESPGFYSLKVYIDGKKGAAASHIVYLEKGDYSIIIDPLHQEKYPLIESGSKTQKELNTFFNRTNSSNYPNLESFITNHPGSIASAYLLSIDERKVSRDPALYLKWYNLLNEDIKENQYGKKAQRLIDGYIKNLPGAEMPEISGVMQDGKPFNKNVLKGKLTLVGFWASWNYPSVKDIPSLKLMYDELRPRGFEIVYIAIDKYEKKWKKSISFYQLNWLNVADFKGAYSANYEHFNTNRLPYYILIGPDLKIIDHDVPLESVRIYFNDFLRRGSAE